MGGRTHYPMPLGSVPREARDRLGAVYPLRTTYFLCFSFCGSLIWVFIYGIEYSPVDSERLVPGYPDRHLEPGPAYLGVPRANIQPGLHRLQSREHHIGSFARSAASQTNAGIR